MANILNEYLDYHNKFIKKYGQKTIVLMQVGSFYEAYATLNNGPNLFSLSEILNIVCTRKDKTVNEISEKNPYMLGFPLVASSKFINMLVDAGYTIITVDQVSPPPKPKREVTNIYSAGTYVEGLQKPDHNYVVCIYLEEEVQKNTKNLLCSGMCAIDLTTGKVIINEAHSNSQDDKLALDETIRFINTLNPKELIIYHKKANDSYFKDDFIKSYLELDNKYYHYNNVIDSKYQKISYQNEFLRKIYTECGQISPIEYLDLDKFVYSTISFVLLLDFSYNHNEKIIFNLQKPEYYNDSKYLVLGNNAIYQLNIVETDQYQYNDNKFKCLFDVVNNTSTAMGRRLLKDRLLYPICDTNQLETDYVITGKLKENKLFDDIEKNLRGICDIERLTRKIFLNVIQPYELFEFIESIKESQIIIQKISKITDKKIIPKKKHIENIKKFIEDCVSVFLYDELKKQNLTEITANFFIKNKFPDIDKLTQKLELSNDFMADLCSVLSGFIKDKKNNNTNDKISVRKNTKDGHHLYLTKIRAEQLKVELAKNKIIDVNGYKLDTNKLVFNYNNNVAKILFPDLEKKSDEIIEINAQINILVRKNYNEFLTKLFKDYNESLRQISQFISYIDFIKSNAKTANLYNYKQPEIDYKISSSYIKCKGLRHPIIERIIDYEYVPHDFHIGDDLKGMLIFGINSSGKSSLMKSAGLSVVMAQAGMFVPALEYKFSPYSALYTRITGNDNLFKGLSSFALEMVELKAILTRANSKTLVIGDEVCRGTEHISGSAIVATTIINLAKSNSSFIFATHLHEIANMDRIKNLEKVKPYHLSVSYDPKNDEIIYDRILKEGSGDNIYGITVARHIIHDKDFIDMAMEIKNELLEKHDSLISGKKSRYNSDLLIYQCQLCGEKDKLGHVSNLETHHINFQKDCENGFVKSKPHIRKNDKNNLAVLCNECHDKIHNNEINIESTVMSSKGRKLKTKKNEC